MRLVLGRKIETKKNEIKRFYENPKGTIETKKLQKWLIVQVAKLFVGIPIVPGK